MNPLIDSGGDELPTASTPITLTLPDGNAAHVKEAAAVIATELSLSRRWIRLQARSVKLVQDDSAQRLFAISVGQNAAIDWSLEGSRATRPSLWHVREPDASVIEAACDAMLDHGRSEPESRQQADHEETDDADVDANSWVGEVVSVDPDNGLMYVSTGPDVRGPVMGDSANAAS